MKPSPDPLARRAARGDLLAVAGAFVTNGLAVGVFGGSLPGLRARLSLESGHIVGVLVTAAVFAVVSMNLSGPLADRVGARAPTLLGGAGMAVGAVVIGAAPDYALLLLGTAVFGLGNGAMDVSMNALGVSLERARVRPVMSRLHASFSIGNLVGALVVVGIGHLLPVATSPRWSLWSAALVITVLLAALVPSIPQSPPRETRSEDGARSPVPRLAWLLAAMALCFGLTEGTAIDWSSLHVTDVAGVSPSAGAWGLACVSGLMVVVRLFGDAVVERVGRSAVVRGGSGCALVGYVLTASTDALPLILLGWSLVGLGVGLLAPQIYGLAGHSGGGRGLALVVSFGYGAFLVGPAVIGFVAGHSSLQRAMLVPVVTALALIVLSARLPADRGAAPVATS